MTNQKVKLAGIMAAGVCLLFSGCAQQKESESESEMAEIAAEVDQKDSEKADQTASKQEMQEADSQSEAEQKEQAKEEEHTVDTSQYEFILWQKNNYGMPEQRMGFNIPAEYVIEDCSTDGVRIKGIEGIDYMTEEYHFTLRDDQSISVELSSDFRVENGKLIEENFEAGTKEVEEKGQLNTDLGTANLYFCKELTDWGNTYCEEIALLPLDEEQSLYVEYNHYYDTEKLEAENREVSYEGEIEKLLSQMFLPVEQPAEPLVERNDIAVDEEKYEVLFCNEETGEVVLGVHNDLSDLGLGEYMLSRGLDNFSVSGNWWGNSMIVEIDARKAAYKQYFSGSSVWKGWNGEVLEKEQVGEKETPFGKALLYYVKYKVRSGSGESSEYKEVEQEAALLNNQGTNIMIVWEPNRPYDGTYDGEIEKIMDALFE